MLYFNINKVNKLLIPISLIMMFSFMYLLPLNNGKILYRFLIMLYLLTFILSLISDHINIEFYSAIYPIAFLLLVIFLWFTPFKNINSKTIKLISYNKRKIKSLIAFCGIVSTAASLYFGFYAIKLFSNFNLAIARDLFSTKSILPRNIFTNIALLIQSVYYLYLLLFFLSIKDNYSLIYKLLTFIGSLSNLLMTLCFFGRDGVLFWILNFTVLYLIFRENISAKAKNVLKKIFLVLFTFLIIIFFLITHSRFSAGEKSSLKTVIENVVSYGGNQLENYLDGFYLNVHAGSLIPNLQKPLEIIGIIRPEIRSRRDLYESFNIGDEWFVFGYFIKDFIWIMGKGLTIIFSIIVYIFLKYEIFKNIDIIKFIIIYTLFQIPLTGVFYYRQAVSYMDYGYLITFIIIVYLKTRLYPIK